MYNDFIWNHGDCSYDNSLHPLSQRERMRPLARRKSLLHRHVVGMGAPGAPATFKSCPEDLAGSALGIARRQVDDLREAQTIQAVCLSVEPASGARRPDRAKITSAIDFNEAR
jgi:hypothetical protein